MTDEQLTLIDDGKVVDVAARFAGDGVRLRAADLATTLGWELKPEGLCRGGICVPVREASELSNSDGVDLAALARVLDRPLALDAAERTAYLATSAADRAAQLATLQAPDFTLPDLSGRMHSLSAQRGKKVLLVAYASW
jgi:hypothetical protein